MSPRRRAAQAVPSERLHFHSKSALSSPSSGLYTPADSFIHRWHPWTKMVFAGCVILLAFVAWPWLSLTLLAITLGLILAARVFPAYLALMRLAVLPLLLMLFVIQSLFYPGRETPLFSLGPVTVWVEGIQFAIQVSLRVLALVSSTALLVLTTRPTDIVAGLEDWGISHRMGYAVLLTLQIVPEMQRRVRTILDAQRTRAVETEGNLLVRARAYVPVLGPLVTSSLMSIETRALVLETRGFGLPGKRSRFRPLVDSPGQRRLRILLVVITASLLLYRLAAWILPKL